MTSRIQFQTVSAERLVRPSARDAHRDDFAAAAVVMAFLGASPAHLNLLALEGLVPDFLAVVALLWSRPPLEHAGRARFFPGMEEALGQKSPCVGSLGQVHYHGS